MWKEVVLIVLDSGCCHINPNVIYQGDDTITSVQSQEDTVSFHKPKPILTPLYHARVVSPSLPQ